MELKGFKLASYKANLLEPQHTFNRVPDSVFITKAFEIIADSHILGRKKDITKKQRL
jgi:hypothetical protein